MIHVLEDEGLGLVEHEHLDVSKEVLIDFIMLCVGLIIRLMTSKHTEG